MAQNSLDKIVLHYEYLEKESEIKKAIRRLRDKRRRTRVRRGICDERVSK